jgi:hypothetical protein
MATKSRAELDAELTQLEQWMPTMLAETDETSQMVAFAGRAELIEEATAPIDREHVWNRLQCMLRDAGLVPGDDEPCSDE